MSKLTQAERRTLNAAEKVLMKQLVGPKEVFMFSLHHGWTAIEMTYFSPNGQQHTWVGDFEDPSFAGKIDKALSIRDNEDGRADEIKAKRVAELKAELARLEPA